MTNIKPAKVGKEAVLMSTEKRKYLRIEPSGIMELRDLDQLHGLIVIREVKA